MRHNALLLQGPLGPFFSRFAASLEARGFQVSKVNFNGGDRLFYRRTDAVDFTGTPDDWPAWLERFVTNRQIGRIYVFGDCRRYHRVAREIALRLGLEFYVFEEGYIRPNFVTLEADGVNGHSMLATHPGKPLNVTGIPRGTRRGDTEHERSEPPHIFWFGAAFSIAYYLACRWHRRRYPHYAHHRPLGLLSEGYRWIRSGLRKLRYRVSERGTLRELLAQYRQNYFIVPLQVHCDMQVVVHSDFNSIEQFIGEVLISFARHAPLNKAIVFKHHPMDRGYTDYRWLLDRLVSELGLQGRVFYVHDVDLPSLLRGAEGAVLINSTVGLSAMFHETPVKTLGRSVYDRPGLTAQCSLSDFWSSPGAVDRQAFLAFRELLIEQNQVNGSLYRRTTRDEPCGLNWSPQLRAQHSVRGEDLPLPVSMRPQLTIVKGGRTDDDRSAAA